MPVQSVFKAGSKLIVRFSRQKHQRFSSWLSWLTLQFRFFLITVFSNTVSKSVNAYPEKIRVGGEESIQKRTKHHTWDAPQ